MSKNTSQINRKQRGTKATAPSFPLPETLIHLPDGYSDFILEIKEKIIGDRLKAMISANSALVTMYWEIGNAILQRHNTAGWGAKVIDRISYDLKKYFPGLTGFSARNLLYMRKFAEAWPDFEIVQRTVALLPWRSNITLLDKVKEPAIRLWYAQKAIQYGYGKDMLVVQIESQLHKRTGNSVHNFQQALPPADSDLSKQIFKDPYIFDFLGTDSPQREVELEQKLMDQIQKFLIELGQGFAFVGRQVHVEIGNSDFYIDLLFYHLKLRCYIVVELKAGDFDAGYIGKLNMYLNAVNDSLRHTDDKPSIGMLLVKSKNKMVVEYSLNGYQNPISVANWEGESGSFLTEKIKSDLPTIEEIEKELEAQLIELERK